MEKGVSVSAGGPKVKGNFRRCGTRGKFSLCGVNVHCLPAGPIQTNAYLLTEPGDGRGGADRRPPRGLGRGGAGPERRGVPAGGALAHPRALGPHAGGGGGRPEGPGPGQRPPGGPGRSIETPEVMRPLLPPSLTVEAGQGRPLARRRAPSWRRSARRSGCGTFPDTAPGASCSISPPRPRRLSGDALFQGSVGRTDLPGGDRAQLEHSIRTRIYTLPDETRVYPGHGDPTTVGEEKSTNPYVRG